MVTIVRRRVAAPIPAVKPLVRQVCAVDFTDAKGHNRGQVLFVPNSRQFNTRRAIASGPRHRTDSVMSCLVPPGGHVGPSTAADDRRQADRHTRPYAGCGGSPAP